MRLRSATELAWPNSARGLQIGARLNPARTPYCRQCCSNADRRMRAAAPLQRGNADFCPGDREVSRRRPQIQGFCQTRFQSQFSNRAARNACHDRGHRFDRSHRLDLPAESIRQNHQAIWKWVRVLQWVNQILLACLSRSPKSVLPARCLRSTASSWPACTNRVLRRVSSSVAHVARRSKIRAWIWAFRARRQSHCRPARRLVLNPVPSCRSLAGAKAFRLRDTNTDEPDWFLPPANNG